MLIMSLVCRVVRDGALCSAYRSVSTRLSLYFKVVELSGGPGSQISSQDYATVLISKLFLCVAPFVIVLSSERVNGHHAPTALLAALTLH